MLKQHSLSKRKISILFMMVYALTYNGGNILLFYAVQSKNGHIFISKSRPSSSVRTRSPFTPFNQSMVIRTNVQPCIKLFQFPQHFQRLNIMQQHLTMVIYLGSVFSLNSPQVSDILRGYWHLGFKFCYHTSMLGCFFAR